MPRNKQKKAKVNPPDEKFNYEFATGMGLATETAGSTAAVTKKEKGKRA